MASSYNGKRIRNVHSCSSSSSFESVENLIETGYISDSSTSDVEISKKSRADGRINSNTKSVGLTDSCVLRKQFPLRVGKRLNDSDEGICHESSRKRAKCFSKNAVMARLNRIKKKQHLENLEKQVAELSEENSVLKEQAKDNDDIVCKLKDEVNYLKSVLANSKEISMLLKSVKQNTGLPVTSSLNSITSSRSLDPLFDSDFSEDPVLSSNIGLSYTGNPNNLLCEDQLTNEESFAGDFGICLHLSNKTVSLELCPSCHSSALSSRDQLG